MKIKTSSDNFKLENQLKNSCTETASEFKIQNAKFNVIHSSEISKVLRELTQCIANDHDLFSNNKSIVDNKLLKENDIYLLNKEIANNVDEIKSEMSTSTSNTSSTDVSSIQNNKPTADKHICLQCGKQFTKRDFLQKHKIVHEIPRHKCMACDKSFVREDKLKRHFTSIHSKSRPHICDVCSKAFARKDKLKDHQKHHLTAGNSFQCTECRIPFVQKSDLNRHFRGVHKGEAGVGINIPSKRFAKSKLNDDITKSVIASSNIDNPSYNQKISSDSLTTSNCSKTMMISNSFYPIQTSILPLNSNNSHIAQINSISDLSKNLIKPNISFIPALPLKVELNYTTSTSLPQSMTDTNKSTNNLVEKENVRIKFKSKRSLNKSKSKANCHQRNLNNSLSIKPDSSVKVSFSHCKSEANTSSTASINCLVPGSTLYPHIPIITPFQSPMISVFPTSPEYYSRNIVSGSKQIAENSSSINSTTANNGYTQTLSTDVHISNALSNQTNISIKPTYSLGTNNITFAHQNLYQFQQNPLRYYSYLQPGSHFFGHHSTRPLTANIYPYMPF